MWVQLWLRQLLAKAGVPEIIRQNMSSNHCPHTIHSTTHLSTSFPRALWHPIHSMISTACGKNHQVPGSKRWSSPPLIGNPYHGYVSPYYWVDDHRVLYGKSAETSLRSLCLNELATSLCLIYPRSQKPIKKIVPWNVDKINPY